MLKQADQVDSLIVMMDKVVKEVKRQNSKSSEFENIVENDLRRLRRQFINSSDKLDNNSATCSFLSMSL